MNLGTGIGYSVLDIFEQFLDASGINIPCEFKQGAWVMLPYAMPTLALPIIVWVGEQIKV